ncbi:hypothetical protein DdX_16553 [Ditylenchus destructor]|uniref:Uncharacterized protein n=1 Tax=Ditylenchus destructor TaxID=166010 RepID=A0AAD4MN80_9BILA|nr:hypothetical protein DdX_16553 [Ditylenchus destructor]
MLLIIIPAPAFDTIRKRLPEVKSLEPKNSRFETREQRKKIPEKEVESLSRILRDFETIRARWLEDCVVESLDPAGIRLPENIAAGHLSGQSQDWRRMEYRRTHAPIED